MQSEMQLQHVIYSLYKTKIEFGTYRCGDSLPTIREASNYFAVSVDTVRNVYLKLQQSGYISLGKAVGAVVKVDYSPDDISRYIQVFFASRRSTLFDMARSVRPLFQYAQWFALKNCTAETLDEIERICLMEEAFSASKTFRQLHLIFGALNNDLYMRLSWQMFLCFQAPLLSAFKNIELIKKDSAPMLNMIQLCRQGKWDVLWDAVDDYQAQMLSALQRFYDQYIPPVFDGPQVNFNWSIYKKTSQICYSSCLDLLMAIHEGVYAVGELLPSPAKLAKEKHVSLNTIRRTYRLLNRLGAVKSINGVGTKVLPPKDSGKYCDISDPAIRKRLLDFIHGFQILSFTCRPCAKMSIDSMDAESINQWIEQLERIQRGGEYKDIIYTCYDFISRYAPYQVIRTVYAELVQLLFWGFPLSDLHGNREETNAHFVPYLEALKEELCRRNSEGFSRKLEALQLLETEHLSEYLVKLDLSEATFIAIPKRTI